MMPLYRRCGSCGKKILKEAVCECIKDNNKKYDKEVRRNKENIKYTSFYQSSAWEKLSKDIKRKYNGICLMCLIKYKVITVCDMVHHITPIREDFSKRLEKKELIPLCHRCHNSIDHINYTEDKKAELRDLINEYQKLYTYPRG
jgi:5-methylcytosine-specific restriction endonuclease McrA